MINNQQGENQQTKNTSRIEKIRAATQEDHRLVEKTEFIQQLLQGRVSKTLYLVYLFSLREIYACLENHLKTLSARHPFATFDLEKLYRFDALHQDIDVLKSKLNVKEVASLQKHALELSQNYLKRLNRLEKQNPVHLLAHAYLRYMGDLSGGQILRKTLLKKYNGQLPVQFYCFDQIQKEDIHVYKSNFNNALSGIQLSNSQEQAFIGETQLGFRMTGELFDGLIQVLSKRFEILN